MVAHLVKLIRFTHRVEDALLVGALMTMLLLALLQIVLRNGFDTGLGWADPFVRILILWVTMLGAMCATRERNHIVIDALSRYLRPGLRHAAQVVTAVFASGVCGIVAWHSFQFMMIEREDATIAFASVPVWWCQLILPLGFGVMAFRFLVAAVWRA